MEINEFDDLINLGRMTRVVKLGKHEIVLGTLNSKEYAAAMSRVLAAGKAEGDKMESTQREVVIAAIRNIDGKELSYQDKYAIVSSGQLALSNLLYIEYVSIVEEQSRILEDAKKNSSPALTP
jgi:hypothetical protein